MSDYEFLQWIYDRLQHTHGENPNVDYMLKLKSIIGKEWTKVVNFGRSERRSLASDNKEIVVIQHESGSPPAREQAIAAGQELRKQGFTGIGIIVSDAIKLYSLSDSLVVAEAGKPIVPSCVRCGTKYPGDNWLDKDSLCPLCNGTAAKAEYEAMGQSEARERSGYEKKKLNEEDTRLL